MTQSLRLRVSEEHEDPNRSKVQRKKNSRVVVFYTRFSLTILLKNSDYFRDDEETHYLLVTHSSFFAAKKVSLKIVEFSRFDVLRCNSLD
jgi:hypothetical protein